ncbi:GNAT family N-acetyltransferase [Escherichia coli]|nr:GNAT family N-acetyltransferase [Escherichia coli]
MATLGDDVAGYAEFEQGGSPGAAVWTFTHTVVDPRFEGRGIGSLLVRSVLAEARAQGAGVLPQCPFVRSYLERHPDQVDLVPAAERGRYGL